MAMIVDLLALEWERIYPALFGVIGFLCGLLFGPYALRIIHHNEWVVENIFVAVFTLVTVTAGFGLAIYTFLLTTEGGFIGRAKISIYYRTLLTYVLRATALSGVLALVSVPLMVVKDVPVAFSFHAFYLALWFGLTVRTTAALYRAGYLFTIFAREHH